MQTAKDDMRDIVPSQDSDDNIHTDANPCAVPIPAPEAKVLQAAVTAVKPVVHVPVAPAVAIAEPHAALEASAAAPQAKPLAVVMAEDSVVDVPQTPKYRIVERGTAPLPTFGADRRDVPARQRPSHLVVKIEMPLLVGALHVSLMLWVLIVLHCRIECVALLLMCPEESWSSMPATRMLCEWRSPMTSTRTPPTALQNGASLSICSL